MYILGSPPQVRGKHGTMDAKTLDRGITPAGAGKTHLLDQFHFYLRDHPRRCGENLSAFTRKNRSGGSPPQVRGKHPHLGGFFCAHRITPAGAGKTCTYRKLAANYRDHPRRCGENVGFGEVCCRNQGSPPQVRGKRLMCGFCVPELGITPAGAGKTRHKADHDKRPEDHPRRCGENAASTAFMLAASGSPPQVRGKRSGTNIYSSVGSDHPRRCGENHCSNRIDRQDNGSPPQVRGKRHFLASSNFRLGITPAGAGKTFLDEPEKEEQWDHPRRCGENFAGMDKPEGMTGSPPQVRGKLERLHEDCAITGITPAGAGKTRRCCAHRPKFQDHPRRCGENARTAQDMRLWTGSPPQVRGKPPRCRRKSPMTRITPAGAGKTVVIRRRFALAWDHPRRCGENEMQVITARVSEGSPPQVRGKRRGYTYSLHQKRITPAGAGKTVTDTYHPHIHAGSPPQVRGKQAAESCQAAMLRITPAGAGKTFRIPLAVRPSKDHPRRCGENLSAIFRAAPDLGSPPQVRGKLVLSFSSPPYYRITPAGAGKTGAGLSGQRQPEDHPRRCGENRAVPLLPPLGAGSPPQVRGKLVIHAECVLVQGITPAGAGKTKRL